MRGSDVRTGDLFSYVDLEQRVPANHPLRLIRRIVNEVLAALDSEFGRAAVRQWPGSARCLVTKPCNVPICQSPRPSHQLRPIGHEQSALLDAMHRWRRRR
jgi:hypothetical protein